MTTTRAILKLKHAIRRSEAGIIDDRTDEESLLDLEIDPEGVGGAVPAEAARAIEKAAELSAPREARIRPSRTS